MPAFAWVSPGKTGGRQLVEFQDWTLGLNEPGLNDEVVIAKRLTRLLGSRHLTIVRDL